MSLLPESCCHPWQVNLAACHKTDINLHSQQQDPLKTLFWYPDSPWWCPVNGPSEPEGPGRHAGISGAYPADVFQPNIYTCSIPRPRRISGRAQETARGGTEGKMSLFFAVFDLKIIPAGMKKRRFQPFKTELEQIDIIGFDLFYPVCRNLIPVQKG